MTSDAIIEAAARNFFKTIFPNGAWDAASAPTRDTCRAGARALAAGLLATESPADPLPAGQVRREPDTSDVEHLPATTRPALPDVPVAVDMRGWTEDGLQDLSEMRPDAGTTIAAANIASAAARAELDRRAAEAGVSS